MRRLIIVGAGDFGREVYSWAEQAAREQGGEWEVAGFLDDNPKVLDPYQFPKGVLAGVSDYQPAEGDVFAMGLSQPKHKLRVAAQLESRGARFVNVVHPTVTLARDVVLGRGCVLCPNVVVSCNATVGNFVLVNCAATIGHDTKIGDGCTISSHADVMGFARLETGAFLGSHSAVLPKVVVGEGSVVGAGSVAMFKIRAGVTVLGVPAKIVEF